MSGAFEVGYGVFCKQAQLGLIQGVGELAANMSINSDKRNDDLDRKLDQIIAATTQDGEYVKGKDKIRVVGLDDEAKKLVAKKKRIIAEVLKELRARGEI